LIGKTMSAAGYAAASQRLQKAARVIGAFFERYDVLLTPTLAEPPILIGALQPPSAETSLMKLIGALNAGWLLEAIGILKPLTAKVFTYMPYTAPFNVTGQPAMSIPLYWNKSGLPIGVQFAGKFGDEATLFRLAGQLENARPWAERSPTLV
jgi:amidase